MTKSQPELKWPRSLEGDPRLAEIDALVKAHRKPLWPQGDVPVARVCATESLRKLLGTLHGRGQVERGLENITKILETEKIGQEALRAKQGTEPAYRVSRLLIIGNTGSERFNRDCERLLRQHSERVLGLALAEDSEPLFEGLFGVDATAKALLISHKEAVVETLLALVDNE